MPRMEITQLIPKKLHFVWVGDNKARPEACIASWRKTNPDYTVTIWDNYALKNTRWINQRHINSMLSQELCGVADLMRYEILYNHGGIALDADSICLAPLEDWLLKPDAFAVWEQEIKRPGLISTVALGSIPHHSFFGSCITRLYNQSSVTYDSAWKTTGPRHVTNTYLEVDHDLTVYPSHYFIRDHFTEAHYRGNGHCFATQLWSSTGSHKRSFNERMTIFRQKIFGNTPQQNQ